MAVKQIHIFQTLKAWFSTSVSGDIKDSWKREGGKEVEQVQDANFIFTSDASCHDTLSIFESEEFLRGFLCIFHTSYIAACLDRKSAHEVAAAKFIVLPADMPREVQHIGFVNDTKGSGKPKSLKLRKHDLADIREEPRVNSRQGIKRSCMDMSHTCSHTGSFVGGLAVQPSDVNFIIEDLKSIPLVSSLPRAEGDICDFTPGTRGFSVSMKA